MKTTYGIALLALVTSLGAGPVWADDEDDGLGDRLFELQLLRVADLGPTQLGTGPMGFFTAAAADPLERGSIEVRRKRQVEVRLKGAFPNGSYKLFFCKLGFGPGDCLELGPVQADADGDARTRVAFTPAPRLWVGTFVLTRTIPGTTNQFVAGFGFPPAEPQQTGVEVDLRGRVDTVTVGTSSFRLRGLSMAIITGPSTHFEKVSGLNALKQGDEVEVKGFTQPDGSIFATRVKVEKDHDDDDH